MPAYLPFLSRPSNAGSIFASTTFFPSLVQYSTLPTTRTYHTCLLGTITLSIYAINGIIIHIIDRAGTRATVFCLDNDAATREFSWNLRRGCTIAIIDSGNAVREEARSGWFTKWRSEWKVRNVDAGRIRVVPVGLRALLKAGEFIGGTVGRDRWTCDGCGEKDAYGDWFVTCKKCKMGWTCLKVKCTEKHMLMCPAMKEVKWFANQCWDDGNEYLHPVHGMIKQAVTYAERVKRGW